jgi:hypothetical protein
MTDGDVSSGPFGLVPVAWPHIVGTDPTIYRWFHRAMEGYGGLQNYRRLYKTTPFMHNYVRYMLSIQAVASVQNYRDHLCLHKSIQISGTVQYYAS